MFQPDECFPRFKYSFCFNHLDLCLLYLADFFFFFLWGGGRSKITEHTLPVFTNFFSLLGCVCTYQGALRLYLQWDLKCV